MAENDFLHVKEFSVKRTYTATLPPAQNQTPARFVLTSEFATGGWANAIEASLNYGTDGSAGGIGATISADCILPNKAFPSGAYYPLHLSFGAQASSTWGTLVNPVAFMRLENWGTAGEFDDKGFLMHIEGINDADGHIFSTGTAEANSGTLRINIGGTAYYIMLCSAGCTT